MCKICSSKVEKRPTPAAPKMPDDKVMLTVEIKDINENLQEVTLYDRYHNILMSYNQPTDIITLSVEIQEMKKQS